MLCRLYYLLAPDEQTNRDVKEKPAPPKDRVAISLKSEKMIGTCFCMPKTLLVTVEQNR